MSPPAKQDGVLGILAGRGELPYLAARNALSAGEEVRLFCFTDESPPPDLEGRSERVVLTKLYASLFRALKRQNVRRLLLLGKATRDILFQNPRFDLRTLWLLFRMKTKSDTALFETVAAELEKRGITIVEQTEYLKNLQLPVGRFGPRLSKREFLDVEFGLRHAAELNRLDVGQSVVVGDLSVLAMEAAEGTDRCIRRGGSLFRKRGAVVCKLPKENHDLRFDIPTIGPTTLESMTQSGCRVIVFRADCTIVLEPLALLSRAAEAGITLLALPASESWSFKELKKIPRGRLP